MTSNCQQAYMQLSLRFSIFGQSLAHNPFLPVLPLSSIQFYKWLSRFSHAALTTFCLLGLTGASAEVTKGANVNLKIGIVQRFASKPTDELALAATSGDSLTVTLKTGNQEQKLQTKSLKLETMFLPLRTPLIEERIVLSTHRSFETAEESAGRWRSQGVETEIAQPEHWQVWAKREIYNTPLLRRLLLQSLQAAGNKTAYLDTQVMQQVPRVVWAVNGTRYMLQELSITARNNPIQVYQGKNDRVGSLYSGALELQPNAYGTYTLVNDVPLETYLRGVVPNEIEASGPYASLEAQAIIARTYVLRNLRRFAVDGYELCADTQCQVYKGLNGIDRNADRAIAATQGQVLTYQNQLVDALYSSTTGGVTAAFSDVWNGKDRPYLKPIIDATSKIWNLQGQSLAAEKNFEQFISLNQGFNESGKILFRWRKESSMEEIAQELQRFLKVNRNPMANFKTVQQIGVVQRSPSGRILKLAVKTDRGLFALEKDEVRSAFVAPKSTLFYLQPLNKGQSKLWGYAFVGGGLGHGVGLSQTGSQQLAQLGWASSRILSFYYPGTQIQLFSGKKGGNGE